MTYPKATSTITRLGLSMSSSGRTVVDVSKVKAHPLIADAAVDAIRQWRFAPHKLNGERGEPVEVSTEVQILFDQTEP